MKIVEATLIMPVTCLILVALMGLMMTFYQELNDQISENAALRDKIYEDREVTVIRMSDRLAEGVSAAAAAAAAAEGD